MSCIRDCMMNTSQPSPSALSPEGGREGEGGRERTVQYDHGMGRTHNYTHDGRIIMQS